MGFDFPFLFWLAFLQPLVMLSILSCGGHLFCFLVFFLERVWGKFTFGSWLPESWLVLKYISPIPAPWPFLRAAVINRTTAFVDWGACVHWWSSCSYRKCPQGGSTFACPTLVPGAARSSGPVGFLGYEIEGSVPEQEGKGLRLTAFPLKPHTSILSRLMPSRSRAPCWGHLGV